jgi:hypothetical protein
MSRFNEKTKNPDLYKPTYWANFIYCPDRDKDMDKIFENRNKFADDLKLKKVLDKEKSKIKFLLSYSFNDDFNDDFDDSKLLENVKKYLYESPSEILNIIYGPGYSRHFYYDHVEVYETTDDKIIILSSPYEKKEEKYYEFLNKKGFVDTELLYSDSTVSFYKIYNKDEHQQIKQKLIEKIKKVNQQVKQQWRLKIKELKQQMNIQKK